MLAVLFFGLVVLSSLQVETKFKSLHCANYDKTFGMCLELFKRANGWRPSLYNITFNLCDFLSKRNNLIVALGYEYLNPYIPVTNYTCPFKKNHLIKCTDLEFDIEMFRVRFPIEKGEYALQLSFIVQKKVTLTLNGSAECCNYREH